MNRSTISDQRPAGILTQELPVPRLGRITSAQIRLAVWGSVIASCVLLAPAIATLGTAVRAGLAIVLVTIGATAGFSVARVLRRLHGQQLGAAANGPDQFRTEALANVTAEAIAVVESDTVIDVNRAFTEIFGYPHEEIVGQSVLKVLERDAHALVRNKIGIESREALRGIPGITRSGDRIPLEFRFHLVNHHGQ